MGICPFFRVWLLGNQYYLGTQIYDSSPYCYVFMFGCGQKWPWQSTVAWLGVVFSSKGLADFGEKWRPIQQQSLIHHHKADTWATHMLHVSKTLTTSYHILPSLNHFNPKMTQIDPNERNQKPSRGGYGLVSENAWCLGLAVWPGHQPEVPGWRNQKVLYWLVCGG
jgi:hypothetical protein